MASEPSRPTVEPTRNQQESEAPSRTEPPATERPAKRRFFNLKSDPLIFWTAVGFIMIFVAGTLFFGDTARDLYASISDGLMTNFAWLYIGGASTIFVFLIAIFVSRFGTVKLGDDDDEPEYSTPVWFAMLFAAGLGATLMFWGAAEPLHHAFNPPRGDMEPMSQEAVEQAFEFTYYHFTAHMWVLFVMPGLALGYFVYKRKMPERLSSVFSPLLKGNVYRWPGKLIDSLAIIGTTFGIAVSVALGVMQINAGMNILWGVPIGSGVHLAIIIVVVVVACLSVASGLDRGVKILSNINVGLAVALMLFVLFAGPTLTLLNHTVESFGVYASSLPELMFWVDSYNENPGFLGTWTVFYWAWTICWGPYVGMFIARISRGRTVRSFIGGVLVATSIFVLIWFSIFGRAAIEMERSDPGVLTQPVVVEGQTEKALFSLLEQYPLYTIVGPIALMTIVIFFITSIDSAALVMDMFATGQENVSPTIYRVGWAVGIGVVTAALVLIDPDSGISAIQQVVVIVALPFFFMEFFMMFSLVKAMRDDRAAEQKAPTRRWERTFDPESLEAHENRPAPGYDAEGNALKIPTLEHDGEAWTLEGDVRVVGDFAVSGDIDETWDGPEMDEEDAEDADEVVGATATELPHETDPALEQDDEPGDPAGEPDRQ